jgi:hypothetical protein
MAEQYRREWVLCELHVLCDNAENCPLEVKCYFPLSDNAASQGCQMVFFHNKNPNLGKFRRALE